MCCQIYQMNYKDDVLVFLFTDEQCGHDMHEVNRQVNEIKKQNKENKGELLNQPCS